MQLVPGVHMNPRLAVSQGLLLCTGGRNNPDCVQTLFGIWAISPDESPDDGVFVRGTLRFSG